MIDKFIANEVMRVMMVVEPAVNSGVEDEELGGVEWFATKIRRMTNRASPLTDCSLR